MVQQRFRLDIAYDGSLFHGWACQAHQRTVAGVLQEKLSLILEQEVILYAAGRTDTGVHAAGQVAHTDLFPHPALDNLPKLIHRCAKFLPPDVRIMDFKCAVPEFDARFSALSREYVYMISTAPYGVSPLERGYIVSCSTQLNIDLMNAAAAKVCGLHDFAGFCRHKENATTIRHVYSFIWEYTGDMRIRGTIVADAFCWSMVRALVGALIEVGKGKKSLQWIEEILHRSRRESDAVIAPAHGLTLAKVHYPPEELLAARAEKTRSFRRNSELSIAPRVETE